MANEQNLCPVKSKKEARERGRNGGIASGKAKREKMIFKEAIMERMGIDDFNEMIDNFIKRSKKYDKSFEVLRDTTGQKPIEQVQNLNPPIINIERPKE